MRMRRLDVLFERVARRILEGASSEDLGFYTFVEASTGLTYGVTFDFSSLRRDLPVALNKSRSKWFNNMKVWDVVESSIIAMIAIRKAKAPCNGAWEVKLSAGPGRGKLVYSMGYYLSPSGALIADRESLSVDAVEAWSSVLKKSQGKPLDDIVRPKTPDPNDDCVVWQLNQLDVADKEKPAALDAINRSYEMGTAGYDFDAMKARLHRLFDLLGMSDNEKEMKNMMSTAASNFFSEHYNAGQM